MQTVTPRVAVLVVREHDQSVWLIHWCMNRWMANRLIGLLDVWTVCEKIFLKKNWTSLPTLASMETKTAELWWTCVNDVPIIIIIIIIIINLIYIAQFDTNGILTSLYIVITYIQMQYVHIWTYMKQSYKYTYTCLHINQNPRLPMWQTVRTPTVWQTVRTLTCGKIDPKRILLSGR